MDYSIAPSEDGQYIVGIGHGDTTRKIAAAGTQAMVALGAKHGIKCFLIDLTESRNIEPTLENVHFTRQDAPPLMPPDLCFATLVDPTDHSHDFHIAFAQTQGINISLFTDREEAIAHLLEAAKDA